MWAERNINGLEMRAEQKKKQKTLARDRVNPPKDNIQHVLLLQKKKKEETSNICEH